MGDTEDVLPPSKKRAAGRELSRDTPGLDDEEDAPEQETGTFKRASDEVLVGRRIVKVRRQQTSSAPSSNPFAGISLIPPTKSTEQQTASQKIDSENADGKDDAIKETESSADKDAVKKSNDVANEEEAVKTEGHKEEAAGNNENQSEDRKDTSGENVVQSAESNPLNSFKQLSSNQNAFTGLFGTGFSGSSFSFGALAKDGSAFNTAFSFGGIPKDGSGFGRSSGPLFGPKANQSSSPISFGLSTNGDSSVSKSVGSGIPSFLEVPVETGEENEKSVFTSDSVLFEFIDGGWKERGKGELKVNVSTTETAKARLVMRTRGNYRLILNASLYADIKLTTMDKRGITFACLNSTGEEKSNTLTTFALKFKDVSIVEEFRAAVTAHKGETGPVLKTKENSPKASDN